MPRHHRRHQGPGARAAGIELRARHRHHWHGAARHERVGRHTESITPPTIVAHSASAKAGSGIPVKFSLNGYQGLVILEAGYPRSVSITCNPLGSLDAVEETVTAGNGTLSYDPTADQYVYVCKTNKTWKGTCRQLEVKLDDGTVHIADFKFT